MFSHGPSCLSGPVTRTRGWWSRSPSDNPVTRPPDRPVRTELVERVRREIAEGTYDTPEKWEAALDRLCRRLEGEGS